MAEYIYKRFQKQRVRLALAGLIGCVMFAYALVLDAIPDKIYVPKGARPEFSFGVPVTTTTVSSQETFANQSGQADDRIHMTANGADLSDYQVECRLFGFFPVKNISVQETVPSQLYPAGTNIGIYVRNEEVLIIGTGEVTDASGIAREPAKNIVLSGDRILKVNGIRVTGKSQMVDAIAGCNGKKVRLELLRGDKRLNVSIQPVRSAEGVYQLGLWVRDDLAGVGTLTYVTQEREYGALGHGVTDADVGQLLDVHKGMIYQTTILGVRKGRKGQPGEMAGMINYSGDYQLGTIAKNTDVGIYGTLDTLPEGLDSVEKLPVSYKEQIRRDKALIISSVAGKRKSYEIQIQQVDYHSDGGNKGILFEVTDPQLLSDTGGIVQGMSGSPIIQDGHIIGAVTHVLVNDPTKGYGIFIETMLEQNRS